MALGDLVVNLIGKTNQFVNPVNKARSTLSGFVSSGVTGLARLGQAAMGVKATLTAMSGVVFPIKLAADAEQTEVAFTTMLGSVEAAKSTLGELRDFTAKTPFQEMEVNAAAKKLLAFGSAAKDVTTELKMIGDISSGVGAPLGELAELYGKAQVQGRLYGEDINQFLGRGIPIIGELAKILGVTDSEVKKMVSDGRVGFGELKQALQQLTAEGGRFHGMTEAQSQTLAGQWSTLKDNVLGALREIGVAIVGEFDLKAVTANVTEMVAVFKKDWMPSVVEGIKTAADFGQTLYEVFQSIAPLIKDVFMEISKSAEAIKNFIEELDFRVNGPGEGLANGMGGMGALLSQGNAVRKIKATSDAARNGRNEAIERRRQMQENQKQQLEMQAKMGAEKLLAGQIRGGMDFLQNLNKQIGPPVKQIEQSRNEVRGLEEGSNEAFEVLRANVGVGKTQDKQLKETQKQTTILEKINAALSDKAAGRMIEIVGLD